MFFTFLPNVKNSISKHVFLLGKGEQSQARTLYACEVILHSNKCYHEERA